MILHNHLMLNGNIKFPPKDEKKIKQWLENLVSKIEMKKVAGPIASYVESDGNVGMTAGVLIETSHIAMHVWDELDPPRLQFDLYTCSSLPFQTVISELIWEFGLIYYEYMVMNRENGFKIVLAEKVS